jgi:2'-phosphotransferase
VPDIVVHGTYYAFYPAIVDSGGLKPMGRTHAHFSTGVPEEAGGVISGMRADAEILVYVDVRRSLEDKAALWWISDNGVVLTEGGERGLVETKYWKKVVGRKPPEVGLLWEDGVEIQEVPMGLRGRKGPNGKGPRGNGARGGGREGAPRGGRGGRGESRGGGGGLKGPDAQDGEAAGLSTEGQ